MIYLCGDTHGRNDIKKFNDFYNKNVDKITSDDTVIQLGDWGAIWYSSVEPHKKSKDTELQLKWAKKKFTLLVVPGNHENYDEIEKLPITKKFDAEVYELKPINPYNKDKDYGSIYIAKRGEIYTIEGETFLALGGAMSQDKSLRTIGIDYWVQELWSREQEDNCLWNLKKVNFKVNHVIAHTCPSKIGNILLHNLGIIQIDMYSGKSNDPTSKFFDFLIDEGLKFETWEFGHFHIDKSIENYNCYFNKIGRIGSESSEHKSEKEII